VESSRSPASGGAGLGLAIVRQLVQVNDWHIWLENRRGGGLAAWISVPYPAGERQPTGKGQRPPVTAAGRGSAA